MSDNNNSEGSDLIIEQEPVAQVTPTHFAVPIEEADKICKYFQQTRHLNWEEAQPYVLALMKGKQVALNEQEQGME